METIQLTTEQKIGIRGQLSIRMNNITKDLKESKQRSHKDILKRELKEVISFINILK